MLLGDMSMEQYELLKGLVKRQSYQPLSRVLNGVELEDFQTLLLGWSLITKSCLITLDTGLGKTLLAAAWMKYLTKATGKKFIYICERGNLEQTVRKLDEHGSLSCVKVTGESEVIKTLFERNINSFDVVVMTYQAVIDFSLNQFLVHNMDKFVGVIVDECQHLGNYSSITSRVLKSMCKRFDYKLFLSATPFRTRPEQFLNILNILDQKLVNDVDKMITPHRIKDLDGNIVGYKSLETLEQNLSLKVIGYTRKELGYKGEHKPQCLLVEATDEEKQATRKDMFRVIKGNPKGHSYKKLLNKLYDLRSVSKKGLIYCNTNENKAMLLECLKRDGFSVGMIDGSLTKRSDRPRIQQEFVSGRYDVLITNIVTGLDLQCDFILFWEMTLDFKQMIGRGERGLSGKGLEIVFILAKGTVEIDYFKENVYNRSLLLKELAGKENDELEKIMSSL